MVRLEDWVDRLQSGGRYFFLRAEAVRDSRLSPESAKKALQRLSRRGRLLKLKECCFAIVPLEYISAGGPPASWFIHDLMAAMNVPYYVGLLSAAALHGASHQQPQEFQVIAARSIRAITAGRTRIRFFASNYTASAGIQSIKTPTGMMRVSTPETTAVDLVRFARSAGHLDHVATVIAELSSLIQPKKLLAAVRVVNDLPNAQRLGYVLDSVGARELSETLRAWTERQRPRTIPLRSGRDSTHAREDLRWHVRVDEPLTIET